MVLGQQQGQWPQTMGACYMTRTEAIIRRVSEVHGTAPLRTVQCVEAILARGDVWCVTGDWPLEFNACYSPSMPARDALQEGLMAWWASVRRNAANTSPGQ